jgi:hypothetical protein
LKRMLSITEWQEDESFIEGEEEPRRSGKRQRLRHGDLT